MHFLELYMDNVIKEKFAHITQQDLEYFFQKKKFMVTLILQYMNI